MGEHPSNAAYVSVDGLVSFDRYGVKLDSNGNRVWDRQRAGDAGASPIQRREEERPQAQAAASYSFPANATGQPVQRSTWDNSIVQPVQGAASAEGGLAVNRPVRESLQNYDTFAARNGWRAPSNWEAGNTWQGTPASSAAMPQQLSDEYRRRALAMMASGDTPTTAIPQQNIAPPTSLGFQDMLPSNAFQDAAQNWGPQGLPMPNNAQYDPYSEQSFSVYPMQRTYNGAGLPMPNNQAFDPYW